MEKVGGCPLLCFVRHLVLHSAAHGGPNPFINCGIFEKELSNNIKNTSPKVGKDRQKNNFFTFLQMNYRALNR